MPWQWTGNRQSGSSANYNNNGGNGGGKEPSGRHWDCPSDLCRKHHGGKAVKVPPHRHCCQVCFTPKSAAPAISQTKVEELRKAAAKEAADKKTAAANAPSPPSAPLSKRALRRQNAAERKAAADPTPPVAAEPPPKAAAAKPAAAGPPKVVPPPEPAAGKDEWLPKPLPAMVLKEMKILVDAWEQVQSSIALDKFPTAKDPTDLDREISEKMTALEPCGLAAQQSAAAKAVEDIQQQIVLAEKTLPAERVAVMRKWAEEEQSKLDKLKKRTQPLVLQHANLVQGRAEAITKFTELQQRTKTGTDKASSRSSERFQLLNASKGFLENLAAALQQHDQEYSESHAARGTATDAKQKALLAKYDSLIESTNEEEFGPGLMETDEAGAEEADTPTATPSPETVQLDAWKLKFAELQKTQAAEALHMQEQIQLLVEGQKSAKAQKSVDDAAILVAAGAVEATKAFDAVIDVDPSTLPDYQPEAAALEASSHLFYLLQQWSLRGGMVPFTLSDLREGLPKEKEISARPRAILKAMLGPVWTKLFPSELGEDAILPRQAVRIAMHALDTLKAKFDGIQATQDAVAKSYTVLVERSKKRRASAATD